MSAMWPYVVAFVCGAAIGSFLNVCIHRLPRHESVVWPGSHCPACNHPIAFYDNIPLLSYLWLKGRCRACRVRIPLRYPIVESANGTGYALILWQFGPGAPALVYAVLFSALVGSAVGSVVGLVLIALKRVRRDQYLPFGPFLALGAIVSLFFHHAVLSWYLGLLAVAP